MFDTYDRIGPKNRLKKGTVTEEGARIFDLYKANVKELVLASRGIPSSSHTTFAITQGRAEYGLAEAPVFSVPYTVTQTLDGTVTFIEPVQRLGFGLGVRTALRLATTPYVWIHQHDWTLIADIPLSSLLAVMATSKAEAPPVKYVCFPSVRMLRYHTSDHVTHFPALRSLTTELRRDFVVPEGDAVSLTPLFFWHDKPHLASREHYLERIFPTRLAIGRGEFIEDRVGQRARDQMKTGIWEKWACWLYYPEEGTRLVVRHLNGRIWRGTEVDSRRREELRAAGVGIGQLQGVGLDDGEDEDEVLLDGK